MTHTKYDAYTNDELIRFVEQGNRDPELTVELAKRLARGWRG